MNSPPPQREFLALISLTFPPKYRYYRLGIVVFSQTIHVELGSLERGPPPQMPHVLAQLTFPPVS